MTVVAIGRACSLWQMSRLYYKRGQILEIIYFNNLKTLYHGITICRSVENQNG